MDEQAQKLSRYADVAVQVGVNLQPGQRLLVRADINAAPLVREIVRSAYQAGAPYVHVMWDDEQTELGRFRYAPRNSFSEFPDWEVDTMIGLVDSGSALLSVASANPELLKGQDEDLISTVQETAARKTMNFTDRITRGATNWAVVAAPSPAWAAKVFPNVAPAEREQRLWDTIFATCRLDQADPVAAWQAHVADLAAHSAYLNAKRYSALHYRAPGTDLEIGLADGHLWISGSMDSQHGVTFVANLPTEEVFTMPHARRVNGTVRASKPLNLGGTLIEDFSLTFSEGRVTNMSARQGEAVLQRLIGTDEGAARLGEVALVPENSPIARSGLLFYNTLFDENAASHIALGMSYRFTMNGGTTMENEAYTVAGGNTSTIHVDFMIGSSAMDIDGVAADGTREPVMRKGDWAF